MEVAQCSCGYLGGEIGALALAETEIGLAVLEHDLKCPVLGIILPCFEEIKSGIGGKQTVPFVMLGTAHKEYSDRNITENSAIDDVVAFELAAVLLECGSRAVPIYATMPFVSLCPDFP